MSDQPAAVNDTRIEEWVCLGRHIDREGELTKRFVPVDEIIKDETRAYYEHALNFGKKAKLVKDCHAGSVYEIATWIAEDGTRKGIKGAPAKWLRMWDDEHQRRAWIAEDNAADLAIQARRKMAQALDENSLRTLLAPLRQAYKTTGAAQRAALLARFVYEVTR